MKFARREFLKLAANTAALSCLPRTGWAEAYPTHSARLIVGFAAGGAPDIAARLVGQWLTGRLGQSFVVENRPGSGGNIATEVVVNAPPDGYTLLLASTGNAVNASLYSKLSYNFIRDIAPVAAISQEPLCMEVHPSFPAKTVAEFIAYARANQGKLTMASAGNGTGPHMAGELFKIMTGIRMVHVPYRGSPPALTDLMAGQVNVLFSPISSSIPYVKGGKLHALAVTTAMRSPALPNVPTVGETVAGYEASTWYGVGAPKNTPAETVALLNEAINAGLADASVKGRLAELGSSVFVCSPAEFGAHIAAQTEKWGKVVRAANLKVD